MKPKGWGINTNPPPIQQDGGSGEAILIKTWILGASPSCFLLISWARHKNLNPKSLSGKNTCIFFNSKTHITVSNIWLSLGPFTKLSLRSKVHLLGMFANSNESVYRNAYYISMYLNLICKIMYLNISLVLLMAQYFVNMWDV